MALLFVGVGWLRSIEMDWPLSQSIGGVGFVVMLLAQLLAVLKRS